MTVHATVPCAQCPKLIDARRAAIPGLKGLCVDCFAPALPSERAKTLPEYETAAWSRGERLG
jgi:NMD protein affecting ribosome stability and mRNA decay